MSDSRYELGLSLQAQLDPDIAATLHEQLADIAPDFARITISLAFGDIASRDGLELQLRALVVISALAALGLDRQLRVWMRFAATLGLTREQIAEAMMQLAPYAGWPRALDALRAAQDVLPRATT